MMNETELQERGNWEGRRHEIRGESDRELEIRVAVIEGHLGRGMQAGSYSL